MRNKNKIQGWSQILTLILFVSLGILPLRGFAQEMTDKSGVDTLFKKLSTQDLIKIKKYYESKVNKLRTEEESYRSQSMDWSESFLKEQGQKIKDRDRVYIRLAEFYIEEADEEYSRKVDLYDEKLAEYDKQMTLFEEKKIETEPKEPEFPKHDYSKAIALYDRILNEYPASEYADDALYGKAWLLEHMDKGAQARRIYREVIDKYPDSRFAPESYMRLAEYYFSPREDKTDQSQQIVELRKAIQLYKNVLKYKNSARYDEALYKLGWSYYKLAADDPKNYNNAIVYFMLAADDIYRAEKMDPNGEISNLNVKDEAVQYIGICFTDEAYTKNGVDKARHLLERVGDRPYGPQIMEAIGNTFQKIDENEKAIYAFQTLLQMYPNYYKAPEIQQNIVTALFALGKDAEAYQARKELYEKYNPQAEWYKNLEASNRKDKVKYLNLAYKYSENALRTNLLLDLEKAEELASQNKPAKPLFEKVGEQCKIYLKYFPTDSNAYDVNWSYAFLLDSRLGRFEDAFNEYIRVSNDYSEDSHREDAALNAVVVADTMVTLKYGKSDTVRVNLADVAKLSPQTLTPEETRLIEAYDNYIRLFPNGKSTPNFLADAGGIYYNHNKFAEAKVYFQTLVKRFPQAEQKSLAWRSIMDSYFALGKFKDSELIAKRILNEADVSEKQKEFAAKRMGQAIFKNAEYLEEQGDYFAAASEFFRVYSDAPVDPKIVEPALLRSGLNYQKAKDWLRAIASYDTLATRFPKSKFAITALQNMAEDYKELEQYANAAKIYERIYTDYRSAENADAALYNASYYYKKAQAWNDVIRVNKEYIQQFPKQSYAVDLYFENAKMYLKLNNITAANKIYQEFAQRYPDDPRTVTSFYERGKYYMENGQMELAKAEFNKAIKRSEEFRRNGKDANPFIAAEAVNKLAEILHREYVSTQLKQPDSNIKANLNRLKSLMNKLNATYAKVLSFGSPRSFEAAYNIARTYEEFASIYAHQEINPALSEDKRFIKQKRINEAAAALYDKAVEQYEKVVDKIPTIAEKLGVDMYAKPDTAARAAADTALAAENIKRIAEIDSTRELAQKWHEKAKDKISELLYTEASLTTQNVEKAISIRSPYKNPVQNLVFRRKILEQAVAPAIKSTIAAHIRNIQEAEKLGLSNKYVEESKRQILLTSNLLGAEFETLAYSAFVRFKKNEAEIKDLIEKPVETTNAEGLDYYALDDQANTLLDYVRIISEEALKSYSNTLTMAKEYNIQNDLVLNTQERALRFVVELTDKAMATADSAKQLSAFYQERFDSTQNYNYDDATGFFENYYYSLSDNSKELLDQAYQVKTDYDIKNLWANKLLLTLIKLDPATYSKDIEKEKLEIFSDTSWQYDTVYHGEAWVKPDFDASSWPNATVVPTDTNQFAGLGVNPQAIWEETALSPDTVGAEMPSDSTALVGDSLSAEPVLTDSAAVTDSTGQVAQISEGDTLVFFRKTFEITGTPISGAIYVTADESFHMWLNGEYLIDDAENNYSKLDTLDYYTFDIVLKKGRNVLTMDVEDKDKTAGGLKFYAVFELLPGDITAAAEEKAKVKKIFVDPSILRKVNILNRNRISLKQR